MEQEDDLAEIRALYPHLTDNELQEAARNLDAYIEHTMMMYDRIQKDP